MRSADDDRAGFLDDAAGALASLVRRRPWTWAVVLVGVAWVASSVRLDPVGLAIVLSSACLAAGLVASALGPLPHHRRWLRYGVFLASVAIVLLTWTQGMGRGASPIGLLLAVVIAGCGTRSRVALGCAAALVVSGLVWQLVQVPEHWRDDSRALAATAAGFAVLMLVARRGRIRWWWIVAAAPAVWLAAEGWRPMTRGAPTTWDTTFALVGVLAAAPSVLLVAVAARASVLLRKPSRPHPTARLVVAVQLRPWTTSLLAAAAGFALLHATWLGHEGNARIVLVVGMAALCHVVATSGSGFDLLGPCLVAILLSYPLAQGIWANYKEFDGMAVLWASAVLLVPLLAGLVTAGRRTTAFQWWGWVSCAALVASQYPAGSIDVRWVIACAAASLVAHAFIVSEAPAWPFLAAGPVAAALLSFDATGDSASLMMLEGEDPAALAVAGPVAVLLALAARRVRSMTAVPAGHPSRELTSIRAVRAAVSLP